MDECQVYSGLNAWQKLNELVLTFQPGGVFIVTDENTGKFCLPAVLDHCDLLHTAPVIRIPSGEEHKSVETLTHIWQQLGRLGAMRNSLLLCLGGGVVTDIGGFAAATFKRGMKYAPLPTTLLSMVDAGIGGKTGIDLDGLKNQVGLFASPEAVFLFPELLFTLPERQLASGFSEMLKHALISSREDFTEIEKISHLKELLEEKLIRKSAEVKIGIVRSDPFEQGIRKALNFGHTIGHAVETWSLKNDSKPLLHGEAIAVGIVCETYISAKNHGLPEEDLKRVIEIVKKHFPCYRIDPDSSSHIIDLMANDKKNSRKGTLNFSLISGIGEPLLDQYPDRELIDESLRFYVEQCCR